MLLYIANGDGSKNGAVWCGLGTGELQVMEYPSWRREARVAVHTKRIMCLTRVGDHIWTGAMDSSVGVFDIRSRRLITMLDAGDASPCLVLRAHFPWDSVLLALIFVLCILLPCGAPCSSRRRFSVLIHSNNSVLIHSKDSVLIYYKDSVLIHSKVVGDSNNVWGASLNGFIIEWDARTHQRRQVINMSLLMGRICQVSTEYQWGDGIPDGVYGVPKGVSTEYQWASTEYQWSEHGVPMG